ncbi:ribosome-associated heat shock protein [Geomicrobium sp. JCM 19037]|uniref:RNA-binding S4 domain-containing protein n=1 Tax=unclassified Geomicrobium TaxID=2628951 RepID=UPI00045F3F1A|nr:MULTISPECIES: RNA-binding S4 domain-containing protein [unclassified Geomicrobium]GAK04879.1 ribosome-associated heat shock protein [Geomicrobium sp. JCM 19037]GAK13904.1 ribosome-associated heat shock protein [Geomicrobium sp. JCM 19039]
MRIDKFLKVSRIIKRRTVAKEVAGAGRIQVNGNAAKAGTEVIPGDEIAIRFGKKTLTVRVESTASAAHKDQAAHMYTTLNEQYHDDNNN